MAEYPPLSAVTLLGILDDLPAIAFIYRDDFLLAGINRACERMIGIPREVIVGRFNLLTDGEVSSPEMMEGWRRAFQGEAQVIPATEVSMTTKELPDLPSTTLTAWVETMLIPLERRADGTAAYVLGLQRDISELMRVRAEVDAARQTIDTQQSTIDSLEAARREIEAQRATIAALSTPVIEVWDGIVTVPLLGHFDAERAARMTTVLLESVARTRARYAILDLTGVEVIDTATADHVLQVVAALGLLGTTGVLVGIQPDIAQTLVGLGVELDRVRTHQNLRQALKACMREQQRR